MDPPPAPPTATGSWTYAATNLTGAISGVVVSCNFSNVPVTLSQAGTTFSGSTSGGSFICIVGTESTSGVFGDRIVVNGTISGQSVAFDFDSADWHHAGILAGNSMSGTTTVALNLGQFGTVVLSGNWSATR